MNGEKIGVVDVGGGYRGIYTAGVLDWCMDNAVRFDLGIGTLSRDVEALRQLYGKGYQDGKKIADFLNAIS